MKLFRPKSVDVLYAVIWTVVALLCLLDVAKGRMSDGAEPVLTASVFGHVGLTLLPFLLLFAYNNYVLIPRFLLPGCMKLYLCGVLLGVAVIMVCQYTGFMWHEATRPPLPPHSEAFRPPHRLFPLPLLLDVIYDALVIGATTAIALTFQRFDDRLDRERLLKTTAENELSYLRAQINPHFYMNMLNNIHGMIEIDAAGAQEMVLDMSHLMRYMLYDSSRPETTLDKEVDFIRTYLNIMRKRYPESRVAISACFPDEADARGVSLPPLLFLVFIENAFKHGISYRHKSFVSIFIEIADGMLSFRVLNSKKPEDNSAGPGRGIGLSNIRQRLDLIYGKRAPLDIAETCDTYMVNLSIPVYATKDNSD